MEHLEGLQQIALNHSDSRTSTTGFNESLIYLKEELEKYNEYYEIYVQNFTYNDFIELEKPVLKVGLRSLMYKVEFQNMRFSGSGNITNAHVKDVGKGCTDEDWAGFPTDGKTVALIGRNNLKVCTIKTKIEHATNHQAAGVIMYNAPGSNYLFQMGLTSLSHFPIFSVGYDIGYEIVHLLVNVTVSLYANNTEMTRYTSNLIAETRIGKPENTIVCGSHLDSVEKGPGINDNGSGSVSNLEIATAFAKAEFHIVNKMRFIWFGAEELGLLGSEYYVDSLSQEELSEIALNLNFDMLASPNYMYGIYNGSSHSLQSENIQKVFEKYFKDNQLPYVLTEFDGRSDYGPFLANGIPAGGLETGAEGIKTVEEKRMFGGIAHVAYDPCYHDKCDTVDNINKVAYINNVKAAAYTMEFLSRLDDLRGFLNTKH